MLRPFLRWFFLAGYCLLIFWQSSLPSPDIGPDIPGIDKLMHLVAYAAMSYLASLAFATLLRLNKAAVVSVAGILFSVLFGLSDEWHQSFIPGRMADGWDFLADVFGAVLGGAGFYWRHRSTATRSSALPR